MPVIAAERMSARELQDAIERRIVSQTGRQIQSLRVTVTDVAIAVTGSASCYYHKQLALQAVLDCIHDDSGQSLDLDIRVEGNLARLDAD